MPVIRSKADDILIRLAFDNSAQANIIAVISTGKIITANSAACKLLGYSKKALLTKNRAAIFDIKDAAFKKMLKERTAAGQSVATVNVIRKSGKQLSCEITSAVFTGEHGIKKSITSITDLTKRNKEQKIIDLTKEVAEKVVAEEKEKKVAEDIKIAEDISEAKLLANNSWIKHIARTSYDVMWDWNIISDNVYIGDSIEEVFGYKLKNNNISFTEFKKAVLRSESKKVIGALMETLQGKRKSWSDSFTIIRLDGSLAFVNSRGSIVRDTEGKAIRMIGATQDVSRLQELENNHSEKTITSRENDNLFHLAAKLSYDVIWDWNILTNEFFLGEGFEELSGYTFDKESKAFAWGDFLHPEDKEVVEKSFAAAIASASMNWEQACRFIKADGTVANVFARASIIRNAEGQATRMIGAIHDLSRQKELEEKLKQEIVSGGKLRTEYQQNLKLLFNSSSDVLYDIDLASDAIILSDGYEKEFGYPVTPFMKTEDVWGKYLHPEDKERVREDYQRMLLSAETKWSCQYRFIRADGSIASILSNRIILRDSEGRAQRMIGSMQDISRQAVLEEKLEQEIKLKEKQINDAMLDADESARSHIGKELHDNVNQLLGVSRLYLEMAKQGGADSKAHLSRSSEYTMNAIEEIRKLTKGLSTESIHNLGLGHSIENLARVTMEIHPVHIICSVDPFTEERLNDKFKLNLYRIIQEQLNNIVKHAAAKNIKIQLSQTQKSVTLLIKDDGVGFDTHKKSKGVGLANIKSRAASFNGQALFESAPGKGCTLNVYFKINTTLLNNS